jgi:hypothetical protein
MVIEEREHGCWECWRCDGTGKMRMREVWILPLLHSSPTPSTQQRSASPAQPFSPSRPQQPSSSRTFPAVPPTHSRLCLDPSSTSRDFGCFPSVDSPLLLDLRCSTPKSQTDVVGHRKTWPGSSRAQKGRRTEGVGNSSRVERSGARRKGRGRSR